MKRKKFIIYGAGKWGRKVASYIGVDNIECFLDASREKVGSLLLGKEIRSIDYLVAHKSKYEIVVAANVLCIFEIKNNLEKLNIKNVVPFFEILDLPETEKEQWRIAYNNIILLKECLEKKLPELEEKIEYTHEDIIFVPKIDNEIFFWTKYMAEMLGKEVRICDDMCGDKTLIEILKYICQCIKSENLIKYKFELWSLINKTVSNLNNKRENYYELSRLDFMITERCSLKCRECLNLMQYYQRPQNYSLAELKESIQIVLEKVDGIREMRVLGGEPLMNPEFYEICTYLCSLNNIFNIIIFTNATIPLNDEKMKNIDSNKVIFYISDYGIERQQINVYQKKMDLNKKKYYIMDYTTNDWIKHSNFKRIDLVEKSAKELYKRCNGRNCPVLMKKKLFVCEYLANATNISAIPNDKLDYIYVSNSCNKEEIRQYFSDDTPKPGCYYCARWVSEEKDSCYVKPAIQADVTLKYNRYE